ncbi:class I SAM-dependent methyltransferase [Burkholderia multivorans]|uniref:class I SAM-dependent methyltransferase n=1 Tax=Burkholderia multivorans TaxID=87883 RepID=UPI001FC856C3|nr:class I SAM-dependent methyltransferase [Burkholderia multivorans]MCA8336430.1 methyltransferase domain-containing protein [Burkholderia multivorans]
MATDDGEELAVVDSFYRAFEDRHRGSRDLIKSRLAKYGPFVQPLAALYPGGMTFDVGCGRGEWLELMMEAGFAAAGVDLDADMLEACRERNLPASQGDAIAHLATLESNSHALVSAFHVVEHVSFEQLTTLVTEALRVLKPGGLLILETPNPENIAVATCNFYIDPSHQKPVPPLLLSFVAEHAGFDRVKVVRLQEPESLNDEAAEVHFLNVLGGVSPDYAIVAQKASGSTEGAFDAAFDAEYGLTIDALAHRYEARLASNIARAETRAQHAEEALRQTEDRWAAVSDRLDSVMEQLRMAERRFERFEEQCSDFQEQCKRFEEKCRSFERRSQLIEEHSQIVVQRSQLAEERNQLAEERRLLAEERRRLSEAEHQQTDSQVSELQARVRHAETMMHQANARLHEMYHSTSWRVTLPLRAVGLVVKGQGKLVFKAGLRRTVVHAAKLGDKYPSFRRFAVSVLNRFPGIKQRLIPVVSGTVRPYAAPTPAPDVPLESLSPRAQQIHAALAFAAKSYKKKEEA